jgi:hypothetical protein
MSFRTVSVLFLFSLAANSFAQDLSLEQIMADPDWLGNQPEGAYWGPDNRTVYFQQKRQGSELRDLMVVDSNDGAIAQVAESDWSQVSRSAAVYSEADDLHTWVYSGDIYLSDGDTVRQITRTAAAESSPMFMSDGRIAFVRDGQVFLFDRVTGFTEQLSNLQFEKDPSDEESFDVLRAHQERLYGQLRKASKDEEEARERESSLFKLDDALSPAPVYFGDKVASQGFALSPDGRRLLLVTGPKDPDAGKVGTMPNYVTTSGHVETREVRTRVGRNGRVSHSVWLVDLETGEKSEIDLGDLPGINEDPLAKLRAGAIEHYVGLGENREKAEERLKAPDTRGIQIWDTQWSADGSEVALWVHANDNKDRWIATVDFENLKLVSQHRSNDEAWVNVYHGEYGWLKDNKTLRYLHEAHRQAPQ